MLCWYRPNGSWEEEFKRWSIYFIYFVKMYYLEKGVALLLNKFLLTSERYENVYMKTTWCFPIKSIFQIWSKLRKVSNNNCFNSNYWCTLSLCYEKLYTVLRICHAFFLIFILEFPVFNITIELTLFKLLSTI